MSGLLCFIRAFRARSLRIFALLAATTTAWSWACGGDDFKSNPPAAAQGGHAGQGAGGSSHGGGAGTAGAPYGGSAGTSGAPHGGAAGSAGALQGGAAGNAGAAGADAGCVEGQLCAAPGGWGACSQTDANGCVGTQSRSLLKCQNGVCVEITESQGCNVPLNTKCGEPWCCGAGKWDYAACGGKCGSMHYKKLCDAAGVCKDLCEYVACWNDGCGAGSVTSVSCP
jgi:hypothetical protein